MSITRPRDTCSRRQAKKTMVKVKSAFNSHFNFKYDASSLRKIGGGGEYDIQIGFGWTNRQTSDSATPFGMIRIPSLHYKFPNNKMSSFNENTLYVYTYITRV